MTKKMKFIWIDDSPARKTTADNLEKNLGVSVKFWGVKGRNIEEELTEIQNQPQPDLILIDHKLEEVSSGIFKVGSTAATFLREKWPECPIVCITAADPKIDVDSQQRGAYEEIYTSHQISKHYKTVLSIAKSFKRLKENRPSSLEDILAEMKAPKDEHIRIRAIIPQEIKDNFEDKSLIVDISRWMRGVFLQRPGFVYDRLWTATILGVKETSFSKIEELFSSARYTGIFADEASPRWWKSKVLTILSSHIQQSGLPWVKGRSLPGLGKADYSVCFQSQEEYPETVAFIDDTSFTQKPMKLKYTLSHPNYEDLLFFEEARMMKPA
jgi:CheY-like chemotaxis protein